MTTVDHLCTFLKRFTLYPALGRVGKLSSDLFIKHESFRNIQIGQLGKITVTQWELAFIAWLLIKSSNDGKKRSFEDLHLLEACRVYAELGDPVLHDKNLFSWANRTVQEQFWWQQSWSPPLARQYLLFTNPFKESVEPVKSRIDQIFSQKFHLTMGDFVLIGAYVVMYCSKRNVYFNLDHLVNRQTIPQLKEVLTVEKLGYFLRIMAGTYGEIRSFKTRSDKLIIPSYEKHELNPFLKYPIVEADSRFRYKRDLGEFVVPNIPFLVRKATHGLYWELRDMYKSMQSTEFLTDFGSIFQEYVGFLLERFTGKSQVIRLRKDDIKGKICDFAVLQDVVVLFECKASLIPHRTRQIFTEEMLQPWLNQVIVHGAKQLLSTEQLLRNNRLLQLPRTSCGKIFKVILTYEILYISEEPHWKDVVRKTLESAKVFREYPNLDEGIYLMDIQQLEQAEEVLKQHSWGRIFHKKTQLDNAGDLSEWHGFDQVFKNILGTEHLLFPHLGGSFQTILWFVLIHAMSKPQH